MALRRLRAWCCRRASPCRLPGGSPITWLGDDGEGRACLPGVDGRGDRSARRRRRASQASPRSFLFYDPAGSATCYYHPSGSATLRLNAAGRDLLAGARALAVTVGPAALTEELLAARRSDQPLAWNVKADADAFPLAIRRRLVQEAAVICLNRDELPFVAAALSSSAPGEVDERALIAAIVHGRRRPRRRHRGRCRLPGGESWGMVDVPANPVQVADPTGAGDAFFRGVRRRLAG